MGGNCGQPLGAEGALQLIVSKKLKLSALQPRGNEIYQQPE